MKNILALLLLVSISFSLYAQDQRVLFVGNSYTYFWNLPQHVQLMAESRGEKVTCRQSTNGGVTLADHWNHDRNLITQSKIKNGKYTNVVLQDHSLRPVLAPDSTMKYGELLNELIRKEKAQPIVYMTWPREDNIMMYETLEANYSKLAKSIDAKIAPVGPAWVYARKLRPDFPLYDPDGSHPSSLGTYLTACVFYQTLTGNSPVGLPSRLQTKDKDGETLFIAIVNGVDALFCQQIAEAICKKY